MQKIEHIGQQQFKIGEWVKKHGAWGREPGKNGVLKMETRNSGQ